MRVAGVDERPVGEDRVVHRGTGTDAPVVDVAAERAGRDAAQALAGRRRHAEHPEVGPHRDADRAREAVTLPRIGRGDDPGHVVEGAGLEVVAEGRPSPLGDPVVAVELVDGDALLPHAAVQQAPMRGAVRAVRVARGQGFDVHGDGVARAGTLDVDRPREDVNAGATLGFGDGVPDGVDIGIHHEVRRVPGVVGDGLELHRVAARHLE